MKVLRLDVERAPPVVAQLDAGSGVKVALDVERVTRGVHVELRFIGEPSRPSSTAPG